MNNSSLVAIFLVIFIIGISLTYMLAKSSVPAENTTTATTMPINVTNTANMTATIAGIRAVAYLNKYFQQSGGYKTTLVSSVIEGGVYHLTLIIGNKTYDSYATVDGRLLFPSALDMSVG